MPPAFTARTQEPKIIITRLPLQDHICFQCFQVLQINLTCAEWIHLVLCRHSSSNRSGSMHGRMPSTLPCMWAPKTGGPTWALPRPVSARSASAKHHCFHRSKTNTIFSTPASSYANRGGPGTKRCFQVYDQGVDLWSVRPYFLFTFANLIGAAPLKDLQRSACLTRLVIDCETAMRATNSCGSNTRVCELYGSVVRLSFATRFFSIIDSFSGR